jgi:hypothetical protein
MPGLLKPLLKQSVDPLIWLRCAMRQNGLNCAPQLPFFRQ